MSKSPPSLQDEMKEKAKLDEEKKDEEKEDPKGIPEFWLTVFKNVDLLSDMLQVRSAVVCLPLLADICYCAHPLGGALPPSGGRYLLLRPSASFKR